MTTVTLFKNIHGNCGCAINVGGSVVTVPFVSGKFFTTDKRLAAALEDLAEHREMGIYVDANESNIDPECATPMDQMKRKLREEILAEMKAAGELTKDAGTSSQAPLSQSLANSTAIVGAAELTEAEKTLRDAQIKDLNTPATAGTTLSPADMLAKLKG